MHFYSPTSFGPVSGKKSARIARDPGKKGSNIKMTLIELVGNSIWLFCTKFQLSAMFIALSPGYWLLAEQSANTRPHFGADSSDFDLENFSTILKIFFQGQEPLVNSLMNLPGQGE